MFAFVGYRNEQEAIKAREWFNGTFLGAAKINVDFVSDEPLVEKLAAVEKRSAGAGPSSAKNGPRSPEKAVGDSAEEVSKPANKQMKEFMEVMKGESDPLKQAAESGPSTSKRKDKGKGKADGDSHKATTEEKPTESDGAEDLDDLEWLKRRQRPTDLIPETEEEVGGESREKNESDADGLVFKSAANSAYLSPEEQQLMATGRLFVRNLAFTADDSTLRPLFSRFGDITEVHLPVSQTTKQPLGTAFVQFQNPADAVNAWRTLDKKAFMGRLLHILPGRAKHGATGSGVVGVSDTANTNGIVDGKVLGKVDKENVKADVDRKRKEASSKGLNWATLYMNSDAVVSSVADRMGIKKSDILNVDSGDTDAGDERLAGVSSAVRLALAETNVISETRKYFETHGVVLDRLSESADANDGKPIRTARSKTTLLVKNIPYGTSIDVLTALFSPHGSLQRVLLPPAGTLAVVEYENEDDAARAFKAVSYRRLGNAVIYLEKAPEGLIQASAPSGLQAGLTEQADAAVNRVQAAQADVKALEQAAEAGTTLFVKNLAFATTTERLVQVFSSLPDFAFARVSTKPDPKNPNGRVSMGFGFVGFRSKEGAAKAKEGLQGFKLDGHDLKVDFAKRNADEKETSKEGGSKASKTTKMIVKNVPFEASKKDIRDLFGAYGKLRSCRIPKKHNSTGRGFAFLDFVSRNEAETAFEALKHTHLLGRHLVLQWAQEEGEGVKEIERLREKTKGQFVGEGDRGGPQKKRKLDIRDGNASAFVPEDD